MTTTPSVCSTEDGGEKIKLPDVDRDELRWIVNGLAHTKLTNNEGAEAGFRISMLFRAFRELQEKNSSVTNNEGQPRKGENDKRRTS